MWQGLCSSVGGEKKQGVLEAPAATISIFPTLYIPGNVSLNGITVRLLASEQAGVASDATAPDAHPLVLREMFVHGLHHSSSLYYQATFARGAPAATSIRFVHATVVGMGPLGCTRQPDVPPGRFVVKV
jgi:hypothetical protein